MFRECMCIGCEGLFIDVRKEKFGGSVDCIGVPHHAPQQQHFPQSQVTMLYWSSYAMKNTKHI
jgi:hypothetical protein